MKMSLCGLRRPCGVLLAAALCLVLQLPSTARAGCLRTNAQVVLDLSRWTTEQIGLAAYMGPFSQGAAQWVISEGGSVATQTLNADASALISPFVLNNERIEGRWLVNTNYDDDFIGFVFGYQDSRHFYVFDWKQAGQQYFGTDYYAEVGMSVKQFHSDEPLGFADLFVTTNDPPRVRLLHHNSIPYEDWTEYGFSLQAEPGAFVITVTQGTNELARIDIQDTNYTTGRFGFYNLSQDQVRYAGFTRVSLPPSPLIRVGPAAVIEGRTGTTLLQFPVELAGENCDGVTVDYRLLPGTATEGQDYPVLPPGRLTFPAGVTNLTVSVPVAGDCDAESDEWVWLVLTNAVNGVLQVSEAAGVILNDDPGLPPAVALTVDGGAGCVLLPAELRLTADAVDPDGLVVRVDFRRDNGLLLGSALAPPYAMTWTGVPPGRHAVTAVAWDDCGLARTSAAVVVEAQAPPGLTIDDSFVVEGATGAVAVFTLTLTSPSCREVSLGVRTEDGTALALSDYLPVTEVVVLRPGETSAIVVVPVVGDNREEPDEFFLLALTNVIGAVPLRPYGVGTILNDDTNRPPSVALTLPESCLVLPADLSLSARAEDVDGSITHVEYREGNRLLGMSSTPPYAWSWLGVPPGAHGLQAVACDDQGARSTSATVVVTAAWPSVLAMEDRTVLEGDGEGVAVFTLSLTPPSCRAVEVSVRVQDGNAIAGADYLPVFVPVTFAPGQTSATVGVPIVGDRIQEPVEIFTVCLTNAVGAVLGRSCAVGTIVDDDVNPPTVELEPVVSCLFAGSDLRLTARAADPDGRVTQVEFREGTNVLGRALAAPYVLVWSNVPSGPLTLRAVATDDFGSRATSAATVVTATLPSGLSINDCTVVEGDGPGVATFTVTLTPITCRTVQVSVVTSDQTALAGSDYFRLPVTLTFLPGQSTATVSVPIRGDSVEEPDETFLACLASPVGAVLSRACGVGTILNDDTNRPPSLAWGALETCLVVPADLTLRVETEDPDGNVRGVSFYRGETNLLGQVAAPPYAMTWTNVPPGEHRLTAVAEDDFGARTTSAVALVTASLSSSLEVDDRTVWEGSTDTMVLFTVSLQPASCREVAVDVLTADGTARAGEDYRAVATRLTFAPGQTSAVVAVTVVGDSLEEPDEHFRLCLTNASGAGIRRVCGLGTILNDDRNLPPVVAITSPADGSVFSTPPGYVAVQAEARDPDGVVTQVQFYANGQLAGTRAEGPYAVLLSGLAAGGYTLVATAVDDRGLWATSAPVQITVRGCDPALAVAPLADQSRCVCDEVVFTAEITSAEPVSIRWFANGSILPGQTNASLRLLNLKTAQAGSYTVEVKSPCAMVTRSATLSLKGQGNANPVTFTNAGRITIYDNNVAGPYPSVLPVDCVPGPIRHVWVTLAGLSHNFPDDVDILLAGPASGGVGPAVRLLSDAGGGDNVTNVVLTFTDTVTNRLPNGTVLQSGVYAPTDYETPLDSFPLPAPAGVTATNFSPFLGTGANGAWSLYVRDDLGGDGGSIAGGWTVKIEWEDTPPRLGSPVRHADGSFEFVLTGLPRMTHVVEASADMVRWQPLSTNVLSGPARVLVPPDPMGSSQRFFRAVRCP